MPALLSEPKSFTASNIVIRFPNLGLTNVQIFSVRPIDVQYKVELEEIICTDSNDDIKRRALVSAIKVDIGSLVTLGLVQVSF